MNMFKKAFVAMLLVSTSAYAQNKVSLSGSDTLGGVMTDAIIAAGMNQKISYTGGGSSVGEKAFVNGEISITAMSREMKPEVLAQARAAGVEPVAHVVALDGIGLFVNASNLVASFDLPTLAKIFTCEYTAWNQVPNSGKSGAIKAYRRNDQSGTTDTFKALVGVKTFGACVTVVNETADIADRTATDADAIGYAGLSGIKAGNRDVAISATAASAAITPNTATIRDGSYPLSRKLYIYSASGVRAPAGAEQELLEYLLDRSFLDPIVQDHDFVTLD
ncbi:MAG: substrate-binding domain-containing protein [Bdellovibrio sp.]|nr:substrate-binding domain-containing protein [Bdellovibrio sp.]